MEDNNGDVLLVREALELNAIVCELLVVSDGASAIDFIERVDESEIPCPHLLIVDLNLPKRPGWEVLQRVRMSHQCSILPIVVLTSSDNQKDKDQASRLGASRYIRKPTRLAEFVTVGEILKEMLKQVPPQS